MTLTPCDIDPITDGAGIEARVDGYYARRCCSPGCPRIYQNGPGHSMYDHWYKTEGFMQWACPDHAPAWKRHDDRKRQVVDRHERAMAWLDVQVVSRMARLAEWVLCILLPLPKSLPAQDSMTDTKGRKL